MVSNVSVSVGEFTEGPTEGIVDIDSEYSFVPKKEFDGLINFLKESQTSDQFTFRCTPTSFNDYPVIKLVLPGQISLEVTAQDYFGYDQSIPAEVERDCILKVRQSEESIVIGQPFIYENLVYFDF